MALPGGGPLRPPGPPRAPTFLSQAEVKSGGLATGATASQGGGLRRRPWGVSGPAGARGGGYGSQVPLSQLPEEELERLTKKLVHDMNHPPSWEYFGRCGGCGEDVVGDGDRGHGPGSRLPRGLLCVFCVRGPAPGASISTPWRGGCIVRAAMWPPWRSAPRAPSPSWTRFCGLWGRPTTRAASPVWCATAAWTAFLSLWMPRARSTASRTSTGSLPQDAQYVVGPSCLSQVRRRPCEL